MSILKIEKSILINAPLGEVFGFMAEPHNLLKIWPSLLEVRNVQPLPHGGYCYDWAYKMAGLRFKGQGEWIEFLKDQRIVFKSEGCIPSTLFWIYQPEDGGTRVTVSVDYTIPGVALSRLTEPVIQKMNVREVGMVLDNLKTCLEV